jgi:Tol biopolymer transport system component/serine/threonine protein kinase
MTPERWQRVKEIFQGALDRAPGERSAFLAGACGKDETLQREVESLIASHEQTGTFIDVPAYEAVAELLTEDPAELRPGQRIASYQIISFIGRGGMGDVYLAEDSRLGRRVALKFLSPSFQNHKDRLRRFEQEARAASALNQPNILTIHEIGEFEGRRFISTEYVEGRTLREEMLLQRLTVGEAMDVVEQIAAALAAAHASTIMHRDIKPENIMLRADGLVKVLDFGLAKLTQPKAVGPEEVTRKNIDTAAGLVMGTVAYMSPEQARGLEVDARTDIWSLGVLLYEMVSGRRPFEGPTPSDILVSVLEREPQPLDISALGISETLEFIISKALTKELEGRYQSAREFLTDIRRLKQRLNFAGELERRASLSAPTATAEIKDGAGGAATHSIPALPTEERRAGWPGKLSKRWLMATAIGLVLIGTIAVVYIFVASPKTSESFSPAEALRTTQIATRTGREIPALSPDGNSIAYASRPDQGSPEIFVKPLTPGAREIQLTSDGAQNAEPVWSPDGKWIAYTSRGLGGIWVIPATGGAARQLTSFGANPAWSADGASIAFQSEAAFMPPTTIWTVSSQGGEPIQITQRGNPEGGHSVPTWSPDGRRIMFAAYAGLIGWQLWTVAAKGGDLRQTVKNTDLSFRGPVYAPDGKSVYSGVVTETGSFGICQIPMSPITGDATGAPQMIKDIGLNYPACNLTISAGGKKLLYCTSAPSGELMSIPISPNSNEAIGEPKPLVQSSGYRKSLPAFSNDGRTIAYLQWNVGENQKIWIMDADGANARQLTSGREANWSSSWLPDKDTIVFISQSNGAQEIHAVSVRTGREKLLFKAPQSMGWVRVSPDGQQLAFLSTKGETINVWVMPATGGAPRQLTFDPETIGWPSWSPDGKTLAVQIKRGSNTYLGSIPSSGGEITQLTFDSGLVHPHDWSPDGDKILFAAQRNGVWNVYWYSRSTRQQKQLTQYTERTHYVRYPSWSPRGDQIVYEYSAERTGNIWLMDLK